MMQPGLLALVLAAAPPSGPAVTIYVGPPTRDGYVDADKDILDTVKDVRDALQKALGKGRCEPGSKRPVFPWSTDCMRNGFRVITDEASADVKLYVVARGEGPAQDAGMLHLPGTTTYSGGTTTTTRIGGQTYSTTTPRTATTTPGISVPIASKTKYVVTILTTGTYQRAFVTEQDAGWRKCAGSVAEDVTAWLVANRERIATKQ